MTVTIRAAAAGDERVLALLNAVVHDVHRARRPDQFKPTHVGQMMAWYRACLEQPTTRAWIAEHDERPVGYLLTFVHHTPENPFCPPRQWLELDQIAVEPTRRRRGIARSLIMRAIDTAKRDGITVVEVTSWSFNDDAHALLRKLGFGPKTVRFELRDR